MEDQLEEGTSEVAEKPAQQEPTKEQPSVEEQMAELQKQAKAYEAEAKKAKASVEGLRASLKEKDRQLQTTSNLWEEVAGVKDMIKILAAAQSHGININEDNLDEMPKAQKQDLLRVYDEIEAKQKQKKTEAEIKAKQEEAFREYDEIWERAQKFGTYDDNDDVADIRDLLEAGNKPRALRILKKLEGENKVTEPKKEETDIESIIQKRLAEEKRKWMEENDILVSDTGSPAGTDLDDVKWLETVYAENKSSDHARAKKILDKMK